MATGPRVGRRRPPGRPDGTVNFDPDDWIPSILEWVASGGTLPAFCRQDGHPSRTTLNTWMNTVDGFVDRLNVAREQGYDWMAHDAVDLLDDDSIDLARAKERAAVRVRMLGRFTARYSEKRQVENTGERRIEIVTGVPDPDDGGLRSSLLD